MIEEGMRKRRRRYTNVPAAAIEHYDKLDCRDLGLLVRMLSKPDGWMFSAKRLAKEWLNDGETSIGTGLRHLAEAGYYRIERRRLRDGRVVMGNAVSEEPVDSWIQDYQAFAGKPVSLIQQPDGGFKVQRPDGSLVDDGFTTPAPEPPPGDPDPADTAPDPEPESLQVTADAKRLVAEWIGCCRKPPPRRVVAHVTKEVTALLDEGIAAADVRAGLAAWHRKGLHPSTLASVVHEVMNSPSATVTTLRPTGTNGRYMPGSGSGVPDRDDYDPEKFI